MILRIWLISDTRFLGLGACMSEAGGCGADQTCSWARGRLLHARARRQGRDDIVYISGRVRAKGESNGKACNLNNTLRNLYPPGSAVDDMEARPPLQGRTP